MLLVRGHTRLTTTLQMEIVIILHYNPFSVMMSGSSWLGEDDCT